jgi:tetratricopeptide (TPR) repeat protein
MSAKKTQVLLIVGALLLFVLLYIAPKLAPKPTEEGGQSQASEKTKVSTDATLDVYVTTALKNVEPGKKQQLDKLAGLKNFDSLTVFWDKLKHPDLASFYVEEKAKRTNTAENWLKAGNRYYYAIQFSQDKTEVPVLYQCAMRCFSKGLAIDPKNTDAKIMLASCYVEGTQDPMEGISRLKAVEKTDSNNVKLQLTFAFFSVKSGQLDKAITRFKKVIEIDSNYIEAYLHLADAYERQNNTGKTIEMLQKYSAKTNDVTARIEIEKYIQQLKQPK